MRSRILVAVCLVTLCHVLGTRVAHGQTTGSIVTWGRDTDFDGSWAGQCNVPAPNAGFVAIAGGAYHSLGVKSDGSLVAWGSNIDWRGSWAGQCIVPSPNGGFVAVAAGGWHSLGLKSDGSIVAWGSNSGPYENWAGQCIVPAPNADFVAVAAGAWHSLGLKSDGTIVAWGRNIYGEGNGPSPNTGFVAIAAGIQHSLGLKSDGTIVAWGRNDDGESNVPAPNTGFAAVAAGGEFSLGLKSDGTIVAWGSNLCGQCNVPAPNADFVAVAVGDHHSVGLKSDGTIVAWGRNYDGESNVPAPNTGFAVIAAGYVHTLAIPASSLPWPPGDLGVTILSAPAVRLSWTCVSCRADSFEIEQKGGSAQTWSLIGPVPASVTTFDHVIPQPGETCQYRVRSVNAAGFSAYSDPACVFIGGRDLTIEAHGLEPATPAVHGGETFQATFEIRNGESEAVPLDLRLAYRTAGGATGELTGQPAGVLADSGTASFSMQITVPGSLAPGWYDLDWRLYEAGTAHLLASLCSYVPQSLQILAGTSAPRLALSPPNLDFDAFPVGEFSADNEVTISNVGGALLEVNGVNLDGVPAPQCSGAAVFCLDISDSSFVAFAVPPGGSHALPFKFHPDGVGHRETLLTFDTNDSTGISRSVVLSGEGAAPGACQLELPNPIRIVSEPGESDPPVANQNATIYLDVKNAGTTRLMGELQVDIVVWDQPGVGATDGFWVGQRGTSTPREVARFLAIDNDQLIVNLAPGETRTIALHSPMIDGASAPLRFFSAHFSDLLDVTVTASAGCAARKCQAFSVAPGSDDVGNCLVELTSISGPGTDPQCPVSLYSAANGMAGAVATRDGVSIGRALWDMSCALLQCAGDSTSWANVLDQCETALGAWENESNSCGCGDVVATYGPDILAGVAAAAEGACDFAGGEGDGAYIVLGDTPGQMKVGGRGVGAGFQTRQKSSREETVRVIAAGAARLIQVPAGLLGQTEFSGFGGLSTRLTIDLLSPGGTKVSAQYPTLATGPGTVISLDLANQVDPFQLSVDDNGDGTSDWTVLPSTQTTVDVAPPGPVEDVSASVDWTTTTLRWRNPPEADFDSLLVRVSEVGIPQTPTMGRKAYGAAGLAPGASLEFSEDVARNGTYHYAFFCIDSAGNTSAPMPVSIVVNAPLSVGEPGDGRMGPARIWGAIPNPARTATTIFYSAGAASSVSLEVFDPLGRRVAALAARASGSGAMQTAVWDGKNSRGEPAASGVYLVRLRTAHGSDSRRIVMLR